MRFSSKISSAEIAELKVNKTRLEKLEAWTCVQVEDAISKRFWLDQIWRTALRMYNGIPEAGAQRRRPYSESIVLEIPLGAKQCDTIVSAVSELIFNTSPPITVRGTTGFEDHGFAFQLLSDKILIDKFTNYKTAAKEAITDAVQFGTGFGCITLSEETSKAATRRLVDSGPRAFSIPPYNFIVPGGAYEDLDSMGFCGYRNYYTEAELNEQAETNNWDIRGFKRCGNVDWVRQRAEQVAATTESTVNVGNLYEVFVIYAYFDIDNDGQAEDLYYIYDRTSRKIGAIAYNPYDSRPFVVARYQPRPHVFYGLGVMEMAAPFEIEVSEWHNFKMANAHLSNSRMWAYRLGTPGMSEELEIGPNKAIGLTDPKNDLQALVMADVYQSALQYEMQTLALADQRVGVNELGGGSITAGKRVPAATAMSIMQQQNRRFATPFNNMRDACADMMHQCFMRLHEQYQKGGEDRQNVMKFVLKSVGPKYVKLVEEIFSK